jgi:signal transduction histidine kinase
LRVIKQHKQQYYPFTLSLPIIDRKELSKQNRMIHEKSDGMFINECTSAFSLENLLSYSEKIFSLSSSLSVLREFNAAVSSLKYFFSPEIFLLNEKTSNLFALNSNCDPAISLFVKKSMANGILDWVFENKQPQILLNEIDSGYENCLLIPIYYQSKFKAVLFTFTRLSQNDITINEIRYLSTLMNFTFQRILQDFTRSELNNTYLHMHTLQSKLENDFRFAALGELTYRSLEEIASPIQVILTSTELIKKENPDIDDENLEIIKSKIFDIKKILDRLVKFININKSNPKISPCSLNESIKEFNKLIEPAVLAENCEIVLDLEDNIPTVLSCSNYLNQILINAFSLINPLTEKNGGIIIQTRYSKQSIILKLIFTKSIDLENLREHQIGINIIKSLMEKHEGKFLINSNELSGSTLTFSFPLIRKVRA